MTLKNQHFYRKSDAELHYIIRDAGQAAELARGFDSVAECKYLDQVNDACTVLYSRRKAA